MTPLRFLFKANKKFYLDLKAVTGYYPRNINLYKTAFIHRSATQKDQSGHRINNERLEFLGDAILGAVIGKFLYSRYTDKDEGFLTKMRSKIVNREFTNDIALKLNLDRFIVSNMTKNPATQIYGDAFEAFVGAVYLDLGYNKAEKFIISKIIEPLVNLDELIYTESNHKSRIIEWGQKHKKPVCFKTEDNNEGLLTGFKSSVVIDETVYGEGYGDSKKNAEQVAAGEALRKIEDEGL
ncbi:MAG: ribonuclease III [Bacteroidetes bacterium GWF2_38_335]|nr:MAG: ribonuclease III [Bacteroidetes bacterium GWF2_38_335]OFY80326.1 MAG: ribonuclease III [Bacteroidetes bacterium RIFOXYA12_FULL_38_20]HBS88873.1 ribonuclease III [Bacteroidales bacterium]